ncbi:MAG: AIR synthase-related protein, partial [Chitinivibrionales bacterium]|nr:AIR synthase-related protein [Chitinivibrionales bacterium]
ARLLAISKEGVLSLSLDEMRAMQAHFAAPAVRDARRQAGLPSEPTNVELEIIAQTWSEHCKHKIFSAAIDYYEDSKPLRKIKSLFKEFIQAATVAVRAQKGAADLCLSVFTDNAGVVRFTDASAVCFKVETHNSPSALDPYGGALTGIVGVNRDSFATGLGCRLIANTDVFCFASPFYEGEIPPRILHPRRIFEGVREGVEHGGNKSGIPTVNGSLVFDDRFLGKPLVYCGTLGLMPLTLNGRPAWEKSARVGDHILMVGGRIGKDGIHGATFSSEPLHEGSPATAVQIGDPITQKRMTDFLLSARDRGLYSSITDNGAGGLSSSIGEMARDTNGAEVHLERAPLKYHGLQPWEIFVSEAQERMTLAVPPHLVKPFCELARKFNVEATDLGLFTDSGNLNVLFNGRTIASLSMDFLHDGLPRLQLTARWQTPAAPAAGALNSHDVKADILALLGRLNICSKEYVVRQYDHEVQGGSVVKPLCGARSDGPSDAAVFCPELGELKGLVVSHGIAPRYSDLDAAAMAQCALDEAVRNAVCAGADPASMAALDNFCWCDPVASPENPDGEHKLAQLVRAAAALHDLCIAYGIPLISGKDSMKNDYRIGSITISIPPTLLVSLLATMPDARRALTMDFKKSGNRIYLIGITARHLGASEYAQHLQIKETSVPRLLDAALTRQCYQALYKAAQGGLVRACHDCSDGGLAIALTEMCFSGEVGAEISCGAAPTAGSLTDTEILFSETPGRIIAEVEPDHEAAFIALFKDLPCRLIGATAAGETITIRGCAKTELASFSRIDAKAAWKRTLDF